MNGPGYSIGVDIDSAYATDRTPSIFDSAYHLWLSTDILIYTLFRTTTRLSRVTLLPTPGHGNTVFLSIYAGKSNVHSKKATFNP